MLIRLPSRSVRGQEAVDREDAELEALDSHHARRLVDLLPKIVARASTLQSLDIGQLPRASVRRYFDEAHQCYLFGLNRACVALCRAMLEEAFKEQFGPKHRTYELLELAGQSFAGKPPLLDSERLDAAGRIFNAGDSALHREHFFDQRYSDANVERFLLDTRKILQDIYRRPSDRKRDRQLRQWA